MSSLVNIRPNRSHSATTGADANLEDGKGVFISGASLVTFPGAAALVAVIWKVVGSVDGRLSENRLVPLIIAILVGIAIFYVSAKPDQSPREKVISFMIAIFNSFFLAATALGITLAPNL